MTSIPTDTHQRLTWEKLKVQDLSSGAPRTLARQVALLIDCERGELGDYLSKVFEQNEEMQRVGW